MRRIPLLAVAVVATALNLRTVVASVPPVLDELQRRLHLSGTVGGLLTTLPVLCFGLLAPVAPALARRFGAERAALLVLTLIAAGALVRGLPDTPALFAGTVLAGTGVAIGNVIVPVVIKSRFPQRIGSMTGLYATSINAGAALAGGLTVPFAHATGGWSHALALWAVPALLAGCVLLVALARSRGVSTARGGIADLRSLLGSRLAWQLTGFFAVQSAVFYSGLAWLPPILRDHGYSDSTAGALLSVYALGGIPASLLAPPLATRLRDQRALAVVVVSLELLGIAGLLVAPGVASLWVVFFALGQGGTFSLTLTLIVLRSPDPARSAELSGMVQAIGYCIAALGPLIVGALHDAEGGWTAPLLFMLALGAPMIAGGLAAGRARLVPAAQPAT